MRDDDAERPKSPPAVCWFCDQPLGARTILRDGIIRSRSEEEGGPCRLIVCGSCGKENLCERTPRGRWFASPNLKLSFLDYLFSPFIGEGNVETETLLAAMAWFRDNEERRMWFFSADGGSQRQRSSWLARLFGSRFRGKSPEAPGRHRRPASSEPEDGPGGEGGSGAAGSEAHPFRSREMSSPHEILGVPPDADEAQIRAAFRRLAVHYHPDKVVHLGEEFERMAKEKFVRLTEAYERMLAERHRGE